MDLNHSVRITGLFPSVRGVLLLIFLAMRTCAFRTRTIRCIPRMSNRITSCRRMASVNETTPRTNKMSGSESLDDLMANVEGLLDDLPSSIRNSQLAIDRGWVHVNFDALRETHLVYPEEIFNIANKEDLIPISCPDRPSPIEAIFVRDRLVFLKRDDLLRLKGSNVSGNKARKMYSLNQLPTHDFPDCVVSYGGPQSNAMVALAAIVHSKNVEMGTTSIQSVPDFEGATIENFLTNTDYFEDEESQVNIHDVTGPAVTPKKRFVYYTKKLPRFLRANPNGNLFRAKMLGMELVELSNKDYASLFGSESGGKPEAPTGLDPPVPGKSLWIPQGGACNVAIPGGTMLAVEIVGFWRAQGRGRPLSVCVPGGTCATALILHQEIRNLLSDSLDDTSSVDIRVVVLPCVGDDAYARRQMMALSLANGGQGLSSEIPAVLTPSASSGSSYFGRPSSKDEAYFQFGKPDVALLETFREMKNENGVVLDLLYGCPAWNILLRHWRSSATRLLNDADPIAGREIMYVHSGGLEGINSQLMRYKHDGLVGDDEIQPLSDHRTIENCRE